MEESKINWGMELEDGRTLPSDKIKLGCLMRIANAAEDMAKEHNKLINRNKSLRNYNERLQNQCTYLSNQNRAYKGVITKLKNKIKNKIGINLNDTGKS